MSSYIYQVMKDGKAIYGGFYHYESAAQNYVDERNYEFILRTMKEINRMNGALRGANKPLFMEMVQKVAKPPYTVKKVHVNNSYN